MGINHQYILSLHKLTTISDSNLIQSIEILERSDPENYQEELNKTIENLTKIFKLFDYPVR